MVIIKKNISLNQKIKYLVFLLIALDLLYVIWFIVFLKLSLVTLIASSLGIILIEGFIVLYSYVVFVRSERKIDVSIYPGKGTKSNPIIIDSITSIPIDPIFFRMKNHYIVLKNLELDDLEIYYSKSITIDNSSFKNIHIFKAEEIEIKNSSITKSLGVHSSKKILIDSSEIGQLRLGNNHFSIFKNNRIDSILHFSKEKPKSNNNYSNNIVKDNLT